MFHSMYPLVLIHCAWLNSCSIEGSLLQREKKISVQFQKVFENIIKTSYTNIISLEICFLCIFFWVFLLRQIRFCRRFGTLCQVHLQRLYEQYQTPLQATTINCGVLTIYESNTPCRVETPGHYMLHWWFATKKNGNNCTIPKGS
jgi:hypothetical protein